MPLKRAELLELDLRVVIRRVVVRIPSTAEAKSGAQESDTGSLLAVVHHASRGGRPTR